MYPTNKKEIKDIARLKTEVEHYFYYSELLQKKRTEGARKKVSDVIKRIPNIIARINEIEKIDEEDRAKNPDFYKQGGEIEKWTKPAISFEQYKEEKALKAPAEKKKPKRLKASGFFNFIFNERKNLKRFTINSQMLHSSFFGFIFKLSNHFFVSVEDLNRQIDFPVLESLRFLLEIGWSTLSKEKYNTLYAFYNFINSFINFVSIVKRSTPVNDMLTILENVLPHYLQIIQDDKYKDLIVESIQFTLSANPKHKQVIAQVIDIVMRIFSFKPSGKVNFYQVFLAVYYLAYKKKITLDDLFERYLVDKIPDKIFVCDDKIARKIENRIDKIESEIESVEKELFVVKSVDPVLSLEDFSNSEDFSKTVLAIMKASGRLDKYKGDEINVLDYLNDDLLYSMQLIITGFLNLYDNILNGSIRVKFEGDEARTRIFEDNVFRDLFNDLKNDTKEISDFRSLNPHISITSQIYERFIKSRHLDIEKDEKACNIIFIGVKTFYKIFFSISKHLYDHYYLMKNGIDDPIEMQEIMKRPLKDTEEEERVITYYYYKIISKNLGQDKTVLDVLNEIAFFTVNFSYILGVEEINEAVRAKDFLLGKSDTLLKERTRYV